MESKQNRTMEKRESVMVKEREWKEQTKEDVTQEQWALLGAGFKPKRARLFKPNSAHFPP